MNTAIKYHVNNDGNPGPCRAEQDGCPFGSLNEHHDSSESARLAYEKKRSNEGVNIPTPLHKLTDSSLPEIFEDSKIALPRLDDLYRRSEKVDTELFTILMHVEDTMEYSLGDNQAMIAETRKAIQSIIDNGGEHLGCGTTRICFTYGSDKVIKIPFTPRGYEASARESDASRNFRNNPERGYTPIADCELVQMKDAEIFVLVMERLKKFPKPRQWKKLPEWTQSVDCSQVGYNSKGELVAYDL